MSRSRNGQHADRLRALDDPVDGRPSVRKHGDVLAELDPAVLVDRDGWRRSSMARATRAPGVGRIMGRPCSFVPRALIARIEPPARSWVDGHRCDQGPRRGTGAGYNRRNIPRQSEEIACRCHCPSNPSGTSFRLSGPSSSGEIEGLSQSQADWRPSGRGLVHGRDRPPLDAGRSVDRQAHPKLFKEAGSSLQSFPSGLAAFSPLPAWPPGPAEAPPAVRPESGHRWDELISTFNATRGT